MNLISNAALVALTNIGLSQEQLMQFKTEFTANLAANATADAVTAEDVADLKAIVASNSADLKAINDALVNPDLDGPATVDAIAAVAGVTPVLDGGATATAPEDATGEATGEVDADAIAAEGIAAVQE